MIIKKITPGTIIGCESKTEVKVLMWILEQEGYRYVGGEKPTEWKPAKLFRSFRIHEDDRITATGEPYHIRLSDLIETDNRKKEKEVPDTSDISDKRITPVRFSIIKGDDPTDYPQAFDVWMSDGNLVRYKKRESDES